MYFYNIRYVFHNAIFTNVPYTTASKYSEEISVRDWAFTSGFKGSNLFWAHAVIKKKIRETCTVRMLLPISKIQPGSWFCPKTLGSDRVNISCIAEYKVLTIVSVHLFRQSHVVNLLKITYHCHLI